MQAHPPAKSEPATAAAVVTAPTPPRPGKAVKAATKTGRPTTLLDVEEVEWITRELERLLAREQGGVDDAGADVRRHHHRRNRAKLTSPAPKRGGFLADLIGRHAASMCSGDDAVDRSAAVVERRGRRRGGWGSFREVEKV